jgi:hypothetical protein
MLATMSLILGFCAVELSRVCCLWMISLVVVLKRAACVPWKETHGLYRESR